MNKNENMVENILKKSKNSVVSSDADSSPQTVATKNTTPIRCITTLVDSGDGSGDCYMELSDEIMASIGWEVGDVIDFEVVENNRIILRKIK